MAEQFQNINLSNYDLVTPLKSVNTENPLKIIPPTTEKVLSTTELKDIDLSKYDLNETKSKEIDTSKYDVVDASELTTSPQKLSTDNFTNFEKIRYGIDKQNTFFGNLYRVVKAGTQAAFDSDLEFKDYVARNFDEEQRELKQKYGNLASGAYDDDIMVQAASMATFMADPFYLFAYLSPWGRAATATYKGIAAISGLTIGLDTMMDQLATTGEIDVGKVGTATVGAAALGPLSVKAFRVISKVLPGADKKEVAKILKIIQGQKAKQIGITEKEFINLQKIAVDKEIVALNQSVKNETSKLVEPIKKLTDKFNNKEIRIENKIKKLEALKKKTKKKNKKTNIIEEINAQNKLLKSEKANFIKAEKEFYKTISPKEQKLIKLESERTALYIKKLKESKNLGRKTIEYVVNATLRPAAGAGIGYAFGRLWGGEDANLKTWMAVGATLGGTQKIIQASKSFSSYDKKLTNNIINNQLTNFAFQWVRKNLATTTSTKLSAYGGPTELISKKLFQTIDDPFSSRSASAISDKIKQDYTNRAYTIASRLSTAAEQDQAIRIVRGSKENASKKVNVVANEIKTWLDDFRNEYLRVGLGLRKQVKKVITKKDGTQTIKIVDVRVDPIKDYFPRVWNWNVIKQDPDKFISIVAKILKSQDKKLTTEQSNKAAKDFYLGISKSSEQGYFDSVAINNLVKAISTGAKDETLNPIIKNLPLSEHILKDRILNGPYAQVEKILEKNNFLVNDINATLNNLVARSVDSIGFASQFGAKGQLLKPYIEAIINKYKGNPNQIKYATNEIADVIKHIDGFFGRYGQVREGIAKAGAGILTTLANTNMLERVSIASLGDLIQPFTNSNNFRSWIVGLSKTGFRAIDEQGIAKNLGYTQRKVLQENLLKTLSPLDKNPTLAKNVLDKPGTLRVFNEQAFRFLGLQWLTGYARRFAYNTGAVDALISAQKLGKYVSKGNSLNTKKGLSFTNDLSKYGISVEDGLKLSKFKTIEEAIKNKTARELLSRAGITASNRDALIPQVSNRLLFTQSRDPLVRLMGQFMSWTLAKSAQTNKLLTRIENGDGRTLVKLLSSLMLFGGVQQLREVAKYGEVRTDLERDTDKWWSEALRLSGMSGTLAELVIGRLTGPGAREPWFLFAPFFSIATDAVEAEKTRWFKGDWEKANRIWLQRVVPFPLVRAWAEKIFGNPQIEQPIESDINKWLKRSTNKTGGIIRRVGYESGDVIIPQKKPRFQTEEEASQGNPGNKESGLLFPVEENKDMNKKDMAAILAAGSIAAAGINFDMDKASKNNILPKKKPDVVVEKTYENISELEPVKKKWLLETAKKVYTINKDEVIPSDIILAINGGETGWGTSRFWNEGSNNLFNFQSFDDKEESIDALNSNAKIKKFKTSEDSIIQFLDWVQNKDTYAKVREEIKLYNEGEGSKERIIDAIAKTGFAEDKKWAGKIKSILNNRIDGKHKKELSSLYNNIFVDNK